MRGYRLFRIWSYILIVAGLAVVVSTCAGRQQHVKLTIDQLRDLEQCVLDDDQIERQNCIERLFPKGSR